LNSKPLESAGSGNSNERGVEMFNAESNEEQIINDLSTMDDESGMVTYVTEDNAPYDWCIKFWE